MKSPKQIAAIKRNFLLKLICCMTAQLHTLIYKLLEEQLELSTREKAGIKNDLWGAKHLVASAAGSLREEIARIKEENKAAAKLTKGNKNG